MAAQHSRESIYVPAKLVSQFLEQVENDLSAKIETMGILLGIKYENGYKITDVYIPDQDQDANSCKPKNHANFDNNLIEWQNNHDNKAAIGWIHTHPVQNCGLTSVDQHQACAWQCGVPSAVSIVYSKITDTIAYYHVTPKGMKYLQNECKAESRFGFHLHSLPRDQIYTKHQDIEFLGRLNDPVTIHDHRGDSSKRQNKNKNTNKSKSTNKTKNSKEKDKNKRSVAFDDNVDLNENKKNIVSMIHGNYNQFGKKVLDNTWIRTHENFEPLIVKQFLQSRILLSKLTDPKVCILLLTYFKC